MEYQNSPVKTHEINEIGNGMTRRIAHDFLSTLFEEFTIQSAKYINAVHEAPFAYRERQLHSMIAPALSKMTDAFLMESPIYRKWLKQAKKDSKRHGWLDYWCQFRDIEFFLELKHSYGSYKTGYIRQEIKKNWEVLNEQLQAAKAEAKEYSNECLGVMLVDIHVILLYEYIVIKKLAESKGEQDTQKKIQSVYHNGLNPKPNWSGLWVCIIVCSKSQNTKWKHI